MSSASQLRIQKERERAARALAPSMRLPRTNRPAPHPCPVAPLHIPALEQIQNPVAYAQRVAERSHRGRVTSSNFGAALLELASDLDQALRGGDPGARSMARELVCWERENPAKPTRGKKR